MELYYKLAKETNILNIKDIICEELSDLSVDINIDNVGNVIVHKNGTGEKIMVSAVINNAGLCVTNIKSDNIAEVNLFDNFKDSAICDKEIIYNGKSIGIVRCHEQKDKSFEKDARCEIELWNNELIDIGDVCYVKQEINSKGDILYGFNISAVSLAKMIMSIMIQAIDAVNEIYFTVSYSDYGLISAAKKINPEKLYLLYGVDSCKNVEISKGCGIVHKDGNAIISQNIINLEKEAALNNNIDVQHYIGKQNKLVEILGITGCIGDIGALSIPVKHLGSGCEVVDTRDVQATEKLMINILCAK